MDLLELLTNAQGGQGLDNIGGQFGLDRNQTQAAIEQLAPAVAAGLRRNVQSPQGMVALVQALQNGNHERYLDDSEAVQFDRAAAEGNGILRHAFGSKDVSRGVAMQAAGQTGIGGAILKQLLPIIASMVLGAVTRKVSGGASAPAPRQSGGGVGDILGDILGGGSQQRSPQPGGGGLGDILGDILGGGASQRGSATQPGSGGLGDILGDILGGGSASGRARQPTEEPDFSYNEDAFNRQRDVFEETLGRGTTSGNAADDLLSSVERHIRRR